VKRAKNPRFKGAICTLNLWILRYAQYDKTGQYDKKISQHNKFALLLEFLAIYRGLPRRFLKKRLARTVYQAFYKACLQ